MSRASSAVAPFDDPAFIDEVQTLAVVAPEPEPTRVGARASAKVREALPS